MQRALRTAMKRVAAIGTSVAMLGMTMGGALAADLGAWKDTFGGSDGAVIIGNSLDSAAQLSILDSLPKATSNEISQVSTAEGVTESVPLGKNIADKNEIDWELDDGDLSTLFDGVITFGSSEYDTSEKLALNQKQNVSLQTSLTSSDDDYESSVVLEVAASGTIKYYYSFDETIELPTASTDTPLEIDFLGKNLKITNVASNTKFTAYVGDSYWLNQGESVTVSGKTVTLNDVSSGGVLSVTVDGIQNTVASGNTKTINGIEITNDVPFYTNDKVDRAASVVVGKDSADTFKNGDFFAGGDDVCSNNNPDDPDCWKWNIGNLQQNSSTNVNNSAISGIGDNYVANGIILGIENKFVINDDKDNPPGPGDCINLPNKYISICFDSLTISDDKYMDLSVTYESGNDFSDVFDAWTSEPAIVIEAGVAEGLKLDDTTYSNITRDEATRDIWITGAAGAIDGNEVLSVFYLGTDGSKKFAGNITTASGGTDISGIQKLGWINYDNTKTDNIKLLLVGAGNITNGLNLTFEVQGDSITDLGANDSIRVQLKRASTAGFSGLGTNADSAEAGELTWESTGTTLEKAIGTKDEDHRTRYGIIIEDPKSNLGSDRIRMKIPSDQVFGKIIIAGRASTVQGAAGSTLAQALNAADVTDLTKYNAILVGGPCANPLTAQLMGVTDTAMPGCATGFTAGEAILQLKANGSKWALIVAGYSKEDTQGAAMALTDKAASLSGKTSATVKVTDLTTSGIEVA